MHSKMLNRIALALAPAAILAFTSCSSTPDAPDLTANTTVIQTTDGALIVDSVTLAATVTAIDAATRQLTLTSSNGFQKTITAGKSVINFDQIKVGDQVRAKATEEIAVFLRPTGTPMSAGEGAAMALAPQGALPGGFVAQTTEVTAQITAVDAKSRKVTLLFLDNSTRQLKVGPNVNLATLKPGDIVTGQTTESLAIEVTKP